MRSTPTLSHEGEPTTSVTVSSIYASTHSYTVMPIVSLSGNILGSVLICLQEKDGKFRENVKEELNNHVKRLKNIRVIPSKSGKLENPHLKYWSDKILS
jgi:hypothetical protein